MGVASVKKSELVPVREIPSQQLYSVFGNAGVIPSDNTEASAEESSKQIDLMEAMPKVIAAPVAAVKNAWNRCMGILSQMLHGHVDPAYA